MADQHTPGDAGEAPPAVTADATVRTGAGTPTTARVMLTNSARAARIMAITVMGADAAWLPAPSHSRVLAPGESVLAELTINPAVGTMPARYPIAVAVQPIDPATGQSTAATTIAQMTVIVDAPGHVGIRLDPADTTAVFGKKISVTVSNSGTATVPVRLQAQPTQSMSVRLDRSEVQLGAGESRRIRGRVSVRRPRMFGHRTRHAYSVTAHSPAAPKHVEASLTARAMFGPATTKAAVLVAVIAVWVALAIVFIPKLADSIRGDHNVAVKQVQTTAPPSGGAGTNGTGNGGTGGSADNGGSDGGGTSGGSAANSKTEQASAKSVQLNGTVSGQAPGDVDVAIAPTSLVNLDTSTVKTVGLDTAASSAVGKIPGSALSAPSPEDVSQHRGTITSDDGSWSFANVAKPGYYELTFSKPGYQTQRYIVNTASAAAAEPLKVTLVPGQGQLDGMITGPHGAEGGVKITITDGTNTLTTSSNTTGDVGHWSISGLSTPSEYLVSASKPGLGTESKLVELDAGAGKHVSLTLRAGVAAVTGTVRAFTDPTGGLGGATVTATDGSLTRTTTTITTEPRGLYTLPDLPTPGTYTVKISASGFLTQTSTIHIPAGRSAAKVNALLNPATASVSGSVKVEHLCPDGRPATLGPDQKRDCAANRDIMQAPHEIDEAVYAGMTLTSPKNSYKVTTASDGTFRFTGVAAGTYVLSSEYAGMTTGHKNITITPGDAITGEDFTLRATPEAVNTEGIAGYVGNARSPSNSINCAQPTHKTCAVQLQLFDSAPGKNPTPIATKRVKVTGASTGPVGYTINPAGGLGAGLYRLTVTTAGTDPLFLTATANVRVPLHGVAQAPLVLLRPANSISGTISSTGNVVTSGRDSDTQYNYDDCVYAVPIDAAAHLDSGTRTAMATCTYLPPGAGGSATRSECQKSGAASIGYGRIEAAGSAATYSIQGLCNGTYAIYVVITNPLYVNPSSGLTSATPPPPSVIHALSDGDSWSYPASVDRKPWVRLSLRYVDPTDPNATARPVEHSPIDTTVWCGTSQPATPLFTGTGSVSDPFVVKAVDPGSVTCDVTAKGGGSDSPGGDGAVTWHGTITDLWTSVNQTTNTVVTLTRGVGAVVGRVISTYNGVAHPVDGATVTIAGGITGYNGTTPTLQDEPVTITTKDNGCFAVVPDADSTIPAGGPCDPNDGVVPKTVLALVSGKVQLQVTNPSGYLQDETDPKDYVLESGTLAKIHLAPAPVTFSGTVTAKTVAANGTKSTDDDANLANVHFTITGVDSNGDPKPQGGGTATIDVSGGSLSWTDSAYPAGVSGAWPGRYKVQASLPGYESATITVVCTFGGTCTGTDGTTPELDLIELGSVSGQVIGSVGPFGGANQPLLGAKVSAVRCGGVALKDAQPTTCTPEDSTVTALTLVDGSYQIPSSGPRTLEPGWWQLRATRDGYDPDPAPVITRVASGANTAPAITLKISTIDNFSIGVVLPQDPPQDPPADSDLYAKATVTLIPLLGGSAMTNDSPNANNQYVFHNVAPTYYEVQVSGPDIRTALTFVLAGVHNPQYIQVQLADNTITGVVQGLPVSLLSGGGAVQGNSPSPTTTGLNDVTVTLGTRDANGNFVPVMVKAKDGTKEKKTATSETVNGVPGTYRFTGLANNDGYVAQFSAPGYKTATTDNSVSVNNGQSQQFLPVVIQRIDKTVHVTVKPLASGDNVSAATLSLTSVADSAWVEKPTGATSAGGTYTWTFNTVAYGDWTVSVTLPKGHYGTITSATSDGGPALTCSGPPAAATACESSKSLDVTGDADTVVAAYSLDEGEVTATVNATPLGSDTVPKIRLTVSDDSSTTVYDNADFPVGTPASFWVPTGDVTITAAPAAKALADAWPADNTTTTVGTTSATPTLTLEEQGGSLTVDAGGTKKAPVSVTITCTAQQDHPDGCGGGLGPKKDAGDGATFTDLAPGAWAIEAIAADGKGASAKVTVVAGEPGDNGDGKAVTLVPKFATLTLTVQDADGSPVDGATIAFTSDTWTHADATTKNGSVTVPDMPVGSWTIQASVEQGETTLTSVEQTVSLQGGEPMTAPVLTVE